MEAENHDLVGTYDLCAVKVETLNRIRESELGAVSLDLAELLGEGDGALGSQEALRKGFHALCASINVVAYENLTACDISDAAVFNDSVVVGKHVELCFEKNGCDVRRNLKDEVVTNALLLKVEDGVEDSGENVFRSYFDYGNDVCLGNFCVKTINVLVSRIGKGVSRLADSRIHKTGASLRRVDVVDLEVERLCLIDDKLTSVVGKSYGIGKVAVLCVVEYGNRANAADLNAVSALFDVALPVAVTVGNANVLFVELLIKVFAPYCGNKICDCQNCFFLSLVKN